MSDMLLTNLFYNMALSGDQQVIPSDNTLSQLNACISRLINRIAGSYSCGADEREVFVKYIVSQRDLRSLNIINGSSISAIHTDKNSFTIGYINLTTTL